MRQATFSELQELLTSDPMKLLSQIGNLEAQLSIPVDGQGLRILVETQSGRSKEVPVSVCVRIGGENVGIRLEARETAQDYEPLRRLHRAGT